MDNDGQFLLIEAALSLPSWLDADTSENRVWIHAGELLIIPPSDQYIERSESGQPVPPMQRLSFEHALQRMCAAPKSCVAPSGVVKDIMKRISGMGEAAHANNQHWAMCTVPASVARILEASPAAVADAVRGFYHRDPISLRDAVKMRFLGPPQPSVNTMVRFSRCLYAQLLRQEFHPPLSFGNKHVSSSSSQPARENSAWLLGSKLAVGLEIAYSEAKAKRIKRLANSFIETNTPDSVVSPQYPFDQDPDWVAYKKRIADLGFFQTQSEGTPLYRSLETKAKLKYLTAAEPKMIQVLRQKDAASLLYFETDEHLGISYLDKRLDANLLSSSTETVESLQSRLPTFENSSDAWLLISPKDLDEIIATREQKDLGIHSELQAKATPAKAKSNEKKGKDNADSEEDENNDDDEEDGMVFDNMVRDMRKFMEGMSGVEGVEDAENSAPLPLDPKKFAELMRKTLSEGGVDVEADSNGEDDDFYALGSDDDEDDEDDPDEVGGSKESLRALMKQMEAELGGHGLRDEFERIVVPKPGAKFSDGASTAAPNVPKSSRSSGQPSAATVAPSADTPIDLNLNLVKNFLESYGAQNGLSGPVSNLLSELRSKPK